MRCCFPRPRRYINEFYLYQYNGIPGSQGVPATLKQVNYECDILNNLLTTTMKQTFSSNSDSSYSESFFEFKIEEGACLLQFKAEFDNKTIIGQIKSKQTAKQEYDNAKQQGSLVSYAEVKQVSFSEQQIQVKLGNLPPNSVVTISMIFTQQVSTLLNTFYAVYLPIITVEDDISAKEGRPILTVTLNATGAITYCESKGYPVEIEEIDSNTKKIILRKVYIQKDVPFSLLYAYEGMFNPQIIYGSSRPYDKDPVKQSIAPVRQSVYLSFLPAFNALKSSYKDLDFGQTKQEEIRVQNKLSWIDSIPKKIKDSIIKTTDVWSDEYQASIGDNLVDHLDSSKSEFIFLLDRSGSMQGQRITQAIEALVLFLQSLPPDSYFNVISFGSTFRQLFPTSKEYTSENLTKAIETVKKYLADLGGTCIYEPLQNLFSQKRIPLYNRQVFLLTDGQVNRPQEVIQLIKKFRKHTRVHAIGIGQGADKYLIENSALVGRGYSQIIMQNTDLSNVIISMLTAAITPTIDNVQVKYDESIFESVFPNPKSLPCILKDEIFNLHMYLKPLVNIEALTEQQKKIQISYFDSRLKQRISQEINLTTTDAFISNQSLQETVFKIGKQLQLNEQIDKIEEKKLNQLQDVMNKARQVEQDIIMQSVDYQLLNKLTGIICVVNQLDDAQYASYLDSSHDTVYLANESQRVLMQGGLRQRIGQPISQMMPYSNVQAPSQLQQLQFQTLACKSSSSNNNVNRPMTAMKMKSCSISNSMPMARGSSAVKESVQDRSNNCYRRSSNSNANSQGAEKEMIMLGSRSNVAYGSAISNKMFESDSDQEEECKQEKKCKEKKKESNDMIMKRTKASAVEQSNERSTFAGSKSTTQSSNGFSSQLQEILNRVDSQGFWVFNKKIALQYISDIQINEFLQQFYNNQDAFMTTLMVVVLQALFADDKPKWNLISKKSLSWVRSHSKDTLDLDKIEEDMLAAVNKIES